MEALITYEVIVKEELFQIDDVPALLCRTCGEQWIDDDVKQNLELMVDENARPEPHVH